ncbi:hypothetical protein CK203_014652 [Vitis vinifera]|uniref:Reverse transcriptase domain-containing protein n=1 Tax=Vitis vinifera TaxID=29760 RepID=A0A438JGF0_VITVI|nr:hypothetical protein CK203_014652 [Vitis vinifera]
MHLQIIRLLHQPKLSYMCRTDIKAAMKQNNVTMLIANEIIDSILKSNGRAILCKLDIEKAYDHVEWSFLLTDMEKMGLLSKLYGPKAGRPAFILPFSDSNGSPCCLLKRAVCGGFLSACQVRGGGDEGVKVSHLLFVDDTLIFCEAQEEKMMFLCWLLMWFEAISRLKVNLDKSELIPMGRVENMDDLTCELDCKVGSLPSTYLGMSLGAPFNSVTAWDGIKGRFHKRMAM